MACCYPDSCGEYAVTPVLVSPMYPRQYCEEPPLCYPCLPCCPNGIYCCDKKPPKSPCRMHERERYHGAEDYIDKRHGRDKSPPRYRRPRSRSPPPPPPSRRCRHDDCHEPCCYPTCKPIKTQYVIPCYRYEDGRIVRQLPVTAFKRNGMQDQEHSKLLGTTNFLSRCPRDVSIECDVCTKPIKVGDPAKVPSCSRDSLGCCLLKKKPIRNQPTVLMRRACEVAVGSRSRRKPFVEQSYCADEFNEVRRYAAEDERGNCCFHFEKKNTKSDTACCTVPPPCHLCNKCHDTCFPCPAGGKTSCELCSHQTVSSPQCCKYMDCVQTGPIDSAGVSCCYYS